MCKTKKIIAGILCAIVAGIGVIGINAQSVDAQTAASQGTIATAGMSLEQLQQIIELLKQQIQQIIVLLQQRVQLRPICVGEGQIFDDAKRQCCAGLVKTTTFISSDSVENITGDATVTASAQRKYICVKPPVITGCTGEGETISASKPQCCEGLVKIQRLGTNPSGGPEIAWSYYTCEKPTAINCAKEGEKIAGGYGGKVCCPGLTRIENGEIRDGRCAMGSGARCTKCGDGICGLGENVCNCPADCAVNWTKCSSKDTAEDCKKNGGHYFSAMGGGSCLCPGKPCYTNGDCDEHSVIPSSNAPKYCRFPDGKCVGPGECVINLTLDGRMKCDNYHPVCGCDGKSYASGCDLEKLNLSKKSEGECNASKYCANEGEYAALNVTSGTRYGCCNGLSEAIKPKGILCYSPLKGEPDCFYGGTAQEGWYYKPVATGETAKLLLYEKCIIDD